MKLVIDIPEKVYQNAKEDMLFGSEVIVNAIKNGIPQEPCEDRKQKLEKEYLFESLCEDLKKLQTENEKLRKVLEQEPILDKIRAEIARTADEEQKHDEKWAIGLRYAVKIIDKHNVERRDKE